MGRNKLISLLMTALICCLLLSGSCKKSDPDPLYPWLTGIYRGTTSQNDTIAMEVGNIQGILYITMMKLNYRIPGGGTDRVLMADPDGLTSLSTTFFSLPINTSPHRSFIDGNFNLNNMTVTGTFKMYSNSHPDNPATGNYTAIKIK
ncbi:MAG: hypothetical protein WCI71_05925 [Bacteroidota bacterium]